MIIDGESEERVCSKIFDNREFGFLKIMVERPLRLNFQATAERIDLLWEQTVFQTLATSKKRKGPKAQQADIEAGQALQQKIIAALQGLGGTRLYLSRDAFQTDLDRVLKAASLRLKNPVKKAILAALLESDPGAEICKNKRGQPKPDTSLRDTEIVPLPDDIALPLPLGYEKDADVSELVALVEDH